MKKILCLILLVLIPAFAQAAASLNERPHWSLELKGGNFAPDIPDWTVYYGKRSTSQIQGSLAYKLARQVEFGVEGGRIRDKGQGYAPGHGTIAGNVIYQLYPLNAFVLLRGVFSEQQWIVPYAGGGWTRQFYKEEVKYQATTRGFVDGYHVRGGIQFLLDAVDPDAANNMYLDYGVNHTYFFIEGEYIKAMTDSTASGSLNLGGTSWLGGLLFEF